MRTLRHNDHASLLSTLKLRHLMIENTDFTDLGELYDIPLCSLDISFSRICDLSPLKNTMSLTTLIMGKDGYHMGYTYKGWSPGDPYNAPLGGKRTEYIKAGIKFKKFSQTAMKMVSKGTSVDDAKQVMYDEACQNFNDFLADRKTGEPFCYWFGPKNVHRKWTAGCGKALWGMDPDKLKGKMPPFLPDVHEVRQDLNDYLGEAQAFDASKMFTS